jgi:hypothetical protein
MCNDSLMMFFPRALFLNDNELTSLDFELPASLKYAPTHPMSSASV